MADVFEFPAQDMTWLHGQIGMFPFQSLNSGHFVGAQGCFAPCGPLLSRPIELINVSNLLIGLWVGFGGQIVAYQVRLQSPFFSSRAACRGEMNPTIPRFTNSSAISRPVHWRIGRPAFSGASPAICSI